MKKTIKKKSYSLFIFGLFFTFLFLYPALASNMTISQLAESYDYDFSIGALNITSFADTMVDTNTNGVNDTLIVNLTVAGNGTYYFIVDLWGDGLVTNSTNATVNSSSPTVQVRFPTASLSRNQYNYTVKARDQGLGIVYEKYRAQTRIYGGYERGLALSSLSDQRTGGSLIISTYWNVTGNTTGNVTAYLSYGNTTISSSAIKNLTMPAAPVNLTFSGQAIAATHYAGHYTIGAIAVGGKIFAPNKTTALYDFRDFAVASYIQNVTSWAPDKDGDNVSENLTIDVALAVLQAGTYTVAGNLFTSDGDFVASFGANRTLAPGNRTAQLAVDGPLLYATKHTGTFLVTDVSLAQAGATIDTLPSTHETASFSYAGFTPPPRPDLTLAIITSYAGGTTNVTMRLANAGESPAYNAIVDTLDDAGYESQSAVPALAPNSSATLSFLVPGTSKATVFVAIADIDNVIDEENETNNVASNAYASLSGDLSPLYAMGKHEVLEATISSDGMQPAGVTNWGVAFGDATAANGSLALDGDESATLILEHDYSAKALFTAALNASAANLSATDTLGVDTTDLILGDIAHTQSDLDTEFLFDVGSRLQATNASWSVRTGEGMLNSSGALPLAAGENASIIVAYRYTAPGSYVVNVSAGDGSQTVVRAISISIAELLVQDLRALSAGTGAVFEFSVADNFTAPKTAGWSFDPNDSAALRGMQAFPLAAGENATVLVAYTYPATGARMVIASANTTSATYKTALNVTIS